MVCVALCLGIGTELTLNCWLLCETPGRRKVAGCTGSSVAPVQELEGALFTELLRRVWFCPENSSAALAHFLFLTF